MNKQHRRCTADRVASSALIGVIILCIGLLMRTGETDVDGNVYPSDKPAQVVEATAPATPDVSPSPADTPDEIEEQEPALTYIGKLQIYGYTPTCKHCCGKTNGITASGVVAEVGRTVAMKGYPFGTEVYIEGLGYFIVEDRGVEKGVVDVACEDHKACYAITRNRLLCMGGSTRRSLRIDRG